MDNTSHTGHTSSRSERNEEILDILLREALIERYSAEAEEFRSGDCKAELSKELDKKTAKIKRAINRGSRIKARVRLAGNTAVAIAAFMGIFFTAMLTRPAVSAAVGGVIRQAFDTHDSYNYYGGGDGELKLDDSKRLGYVPEGYSLCTAYYKKTSAFLTYEHKDDKDGENSIYLSYALADRYSFAVDNENCTFYEICDKGIVYYFYESNDMLRPSSVLWYNGDYCYLLHAPLPREEIMKMADSIN